VTVYYLQIILILNGLCNANVRKAIFIGAIGITFLSQVPVGVILVKLKVC
jgi:hypothetical protein